MPKILKPTEEQALKYDGIYPIHGYVKLDGVECVLEDLRRFATDFDPRWEMVAPEGYHFFPEGTHTVLGFSQKDLFDRLAGTSVNKCEKGCDCGWDVK